MVAVAKMVPYVTACAIGGPWVDRIGLLGAVNYERIAPGMVARVGGLLMALSFAGIPRYR
jgi:hypothetical protein